MLNEVRARHIQKKVVDAVEPGRTIGGILNFEVAIREDAIRGLKAHVEREQDEISFLKSLDAKDLQKEVEERQNGS